MPRINNTDYRNRRAALQTDWEKGGTVLSRIAADQYEALRTFYLFDVPLRSSDFAAARSEATKPDPSLVARAGLAYRSFAKLMRQRQPASTLTFPARSSLRATARTPRASKRQVVAFSEVNPNVDPMEIARIITAMALEQLTKVRAEDDPALR